jgi:chemotaxis signal transduction protein
MVKAERVIFLVGEKEKWVLKEINRVRKTLKCKSSVTLVPGADHAIKGNYRKALLKVVSGL